MFAPCLFDVQCVVCAVLCVQCGVCVLHANLQYSHLQYLNMHRSIVPCDMQGRAWQGSTRNGGPGPGWRKHG